MGISIIDLEGKILYSNIVFADIHGYKPEEIEGKHFSTFHTGEQMKSVEEFNQTILREGYNKGELWHRRRDGTVFPAYMHNSLIRDGEGIPVAIVGTIQDITGLKSMQQALEESERKYRSVFQNTGTATVIMEEDKTISLVNDEFVHLTGYSREEVEDSKKWSDFITEEYLEKMERYHRDIRRENSSVPHRHEFDIKDRDNNIKNILATVDIIPGTSRSIASLHDITEQKRTIEALKESEKRFRTMFENTPGGIVIVGPDYMIRDVNCRTCEITGYSRDELVGELCDIICPKGSESRQCPIWEEGTDGFTGMDTAIKCKGGSKKPILKNAKKIELGGEVSILENYQDISERKYLEEERQKHSKLESLGTLAGGIAHDFNNLLGAISGYIEIAKMEAENPEVAGNLENSIKAIQRAKSLTQQLLTFSKGGAPVKEFLDVREIIRETAEFSIRGSGANAGYDFDDQLWNIHADRGQIGQVFQNLTINAVQAMPRGGKLIFRACNKRIHSHHRLKPGSYIKIVVKDEGTGIPAKYINSIFDPYFTTKQEGSGLGLATVFSIVKNHEGDIEVQSVPGDGTGFTIYLPATGRDVETRSHRQDQITRGNGEKILVLEDDELVGKSLDRMLKSLNYSPEIVTRGDEALGCYRDAMESGNPFDVVITDLTVKGDRGGEEINQLILECHPGARTIVSSGYATDPVMANFREYGYRATLPKPVMLKKLADTLNRVIREEP